MHIPEVPSVDADPVHRAPDPPSDVTRSWLAVRRSGAPPEETCPFPGARRDEPRALPQATSGYAMERRIATGGMGEVWEARQLSLARTIAVKRIRPDTLQYLAEDERRGFEEDFRHEAVVTASLEHPNIVPVHDLGAAEDGSPLLAMKRVAGRSWDLLLREDMERLPVEEFLDRHVPTLVAMAQAVAFAHSRGIVHRDLKPAQVMVGEFGEVLLMDWGLALVYESPRGATRDASIATVVTASSPAGTPAMMAPEQTRDRAFEVGPWTDVYLLGGTLYFLLTGTYPHMAASPEQTLARARRGIVEPPAERAPHRAAPPELAALCMEALQPEPPRRVASAEAFATRLRDYITGAGRRAQAEARIAEAETLAADPAFGSQSRALALHDEASRLWDAHPRREALRVRVVASLAALSLERGDLVLAEQHARTLPADMPQRDGVIRGVAAARARARRMRLMLAAAVSCALVLAAAVASVSWWTARRLEALNTSLGEANTGLAKESALAESRRRVAFEQYLRGGKLISFMLIDLRNSLDLNRPEDRAIADRIAKGIVDYFRNESAAELDQDLLLGHLELGYGSLKQLHALGLSGEGAALADLLLPASERCTDRLLRMRLLSGAGAAYASAGRPEDAEESLSLALHMIDEGGDTTDEGTFATLANIAELRVQLGDEQGADEIYAEVLARLDRATTLSPPLSLTLRNNIAVRARQRGEIGVARAQFERILNERIALQGAMSPDVATARSNFARALLDAGETTAAIEQANAAVATGLRIFGERNDNTAFYLATLGRAEFDAGRRADGIATTRRALAATMLPDGKPTAGATSHRAQLIGLLAREGQRAEAITLLETQLESTVAHIGADAPRANEERRFLATLLALEGRADDARRVAGERRVSIERTSAEEAPERASIADLERRLDAIAVMNSGDGARAAAVAAELEATPGAVGLELLLLIAELHDIAGDHAAALAVMDRHRARLTPGPKIHAAFEPMARRLAERYPQSARNSPAGS